MATSNPIGTIGYQQAETPYQIECEYCYICKCSIFPDQYADYDWIHQNVDFIDQQVELDRPWTSAELELAASLKADYLAYLAEHPAILFVRRYDELIRQRTANPTPSEPKADWFAEHQKHQARDRALRQLAIGQVDQVQPLTERELFELCNRHHCLDLIQNYHHNSCLDVCDINSDDECPGWSIQNRRCDSDNIKGFSVEIRASELRLTEFTIKTEQMPYLQVDHW